MLRWTWLTPFVLLAAAGANAPQAQNPLSAASVRLIKAAPEPAVGPPAQAPHVGSHGSTVVVTSRGILVAERNAGLLVRAGSAGEALTQLKLHANMGQLVHDGRGSVFVADRSADRVLRIDDGKALSIAASTAVHEPHGLALTPDGKTLLVTSVSAHALVALATHDLSVRWSRELRAEPRGVAVATDGSQAVVGFLSGSALALVDLDSEGHSIAWQALDPRDQVQVSLDDWQRLTAELGEAPSRFRVPTETGRRYARNAFAVGYIGHDLAVAAYEVAIPQLTFRPSVGSEDKYGGVQSIPPLHHRVSVLANAGTLQSRLSASQVTAHQPRALAYDGAGDTLYIGGYGNDHVLAIAQASQPTAYLAWSVATKGGACGIDGLALGPKQLWVHCELSRRLVAVALEDITINEGTAVVPQTVGPELAASLRSAEVERGAELFRRAGDADLSDGGVFACASCHPEGRADGLTWRLGRSIRQTPMLAGRVKGTAPYKWDGEDLTLAQSMRHTIGRLGGHPEKLSPRTFADLQAFVESLPAPRPRPSHDAPAVARGKALFASKALGCDACHDGALLTDGGMYPVGGGLDITDTPSLLGLGHSAPYYHDGSAPDLKTLLTDRGSVHDMADFSGLTASQLADLGSFLNTL